MGTGPGGAFLAYELRRAGLTVLALEKQSFPRYHIGESLTGMVGEIVRELGLEAEMDRRAFPRKGGVKVIGKDAKSEFFVPVLASTWQVRRDEFDEILLRKATDAGAVHRLGTAKAVVRDGDRVVGLRYVPDEAPNELRTVRTGFVVDASGLGMFSSKIGLAGPRTLYDFSRQVAVFSQYRGVRRDPGEMGRNTFIFYSRIHEWAWMIPIAPDVVSIGIVAPVERLRACDNDPAALLRWGLETVNPDLASRMGEAVAIEPPRAVADYSYDVRPYCGDGWLCIGDSHRFLDPIFSFGVSFAMLEGRAAAKTIASILAGGDRDSALRGYETYCDGGQDVALDILRYFWAYPIFFGYQIRGRYRRDFIRLLGSDFHKPDEIEAVKLIREQLRQARAGGTSGPIAAS